MKIRVNTQQTGVETNVKHSMVRLFDLCYSSSNDVCPQNPFDEIGWYSYKENILGTNLQIAVEEAVRLREKLKDAVKNITVVTIGPTKASEVLRTALAMGADKGIHVEIPETLNPEPLGIAKALREVMKKEKPDLVILGKQAIDDDAGQTGQMLAGLMGWSQATFASKVEVDEPRGVVTVTREVDGGSQKVECKLPAIVTTDLRCVCCRRR